MKNATLIVFSIFSIVFVGCSTAEQTESISIMERNRASIIEANEELFHKGNVAYADELFTSDYAEAGPDWIKDYIENIRTAFPDIQVSVNPIIAEGNKTAWLRTHTATHQGAFLGYEPSNRKITWRTMIISEYTEDGKVKKEWSVDDLIEVLQNQKMEMDKMQEEEGQ